MTSSADQFTIPKTMTAVRIYEHGEPEVLKVERHPVPVPGPLEVLVRVKATSCSWWDIAYREGGHIKPIPGRMATPLPQQLGREAAGDVVEVGSSVKNFRVGDKIVMLPNPACGRCSFCCRGLDNLCIDTSLPAHTSFGAYAEYITRPENGILRAPENLSYEKLACVLWSYSTVWHMMSGRAQLKTGESVLVTGASGGMGSACLQLAKLVGARPIIALCSRSDKEQSLRDAGAHVVLNYKDPDVLTQIRANAPGGFGVDVVLDNVGGEKIVQLGFDAVKMGGRVVLAATMAGNEMKFDILQCFVKNINILGTRSARRIDQEAMLRFAQEGLIDPIISHTLPLTDVVEANRILKNGQHTGKIVLIP